MEICLEGHLILQDRTGWKTALVPIYVTGQDRMEGSATGHDRTKILVLCRVLVMQRLRLITRGAANLKFGEHVRRRTVILAVRRTGEP